MGNVVEINPLTRVEGHGKVRLFLDGGSVQRVELSLFESPRLFESLLIGKKFAEVPEIICRICSLCSTIHKVTALMAVEQAFAVRVSRVTELTRELIVNGGLIQSHALHLYCLVLPDLVGASGVAGVAEEAPELLKRGLTVKGVGNLIQELVGGRLIHPVNITLGGLGQRVGKGTLQRIKDELAAIVPICREALTLFTPSPPWPQLPSPAFLALGCAAQTFAGDEFRASGGLSFPVGGYRERIKETVARDSSAKYAWLDGNPPTVGALARMNLGFSACADAAEAFDAVKERIIGQDMRGNNVAQAVELCQVVERSLALVDELLELHGEELVQAEIRPAKGSGTAGCEAPRGVLIHSYAFDAEGYCTDADILTPTSLNQGALARDLLALAQGLEGADQAELAAALERLVRCYDPCISCSVHVIRL